MYADAMCGVSRIPPGDEDSPPGAARFVTAAAETDDEGTVQEA